MERDYQKTSSRLKSYNKDSNELLNTGPQRKGSPYNDIKVTRGKSAPPGAPGGGWGALEEEKDEKSRKTYKIRIKSTIKEKKKKKYSVHGGKYYDFSFLDTPSDESSDDGEE